MQHLNDISKKIADEIILHHNSSGPFMVNISGCMGSGKTTFANQISISLKTHGKKVTVVSEDDFLQPRSYRSDLESIFYSEGKWKSKSKWEVHENWIRLDLMKQAILNLRSSTSITYHPYLRETGTYDHESKLVVPSEIILFETSIFSELFNYVILIEVSNEELLKRKMTRDSDLRNREKIEKYHTVAQWPYWMHNRPQNPDLVIDNNDIQRPRVISLG